eukprot:gene10610-7374_t
MKKTLFAVAFFADVLFTVSAALLIDVALGVPRQRSIDLRIPVLKQATTTIEGNNNNPKTSLLWVENEKVTFCTTGRGKSEKKRGYATEHTKNKNKNKTHGNVA